MASDTRTATVAELQSEGALLVEDGNHGEYRPRPNEFVNDGIPFIRAADMEDGRVLFESAERISGTALARIRKGIGKPGDILLSHKGTVGKVAKTPLDCEPFVCSPQTTFWRVIDERKIDRRYLFAYLKSRAFVTQLDSRKRETDMADYVSLTNQRTLTVTLPTITKQRAIAHVLGTLDDKIELNRQMNETLNKLAEAVFESSCKNTIGKGSHLATIDEATSLIIDYRGKTPKKLGHDWSSSGIPAVSAKNIKRGRLVEKQAMKFVDDELYEIWMKDKLAVGDVLMTSEAPLGEVFYTARDPQLCLSQRVFALRANPEKCLSSFLYFFLASPAAQERLQSRGTGTTVVGIRQSELRKIEIPLPPLSVQEQIHPFLESCLQRIASNAEENETLAALRDALLPKLLSGAVRVQSTSAVSS